MARKASCTSSLNAKTGILAHVLVTEHVMEVLPNSRHWLKTHLQRIVLTGSYSLYSKKLAVPAPDPL
jgi:hypothetical protein